MAAMKEEVSSLLNQFEPGTLRKEFIGNRDYHCGKIHGVDTILVFSRWGKVASASTATTLINHFGVDFILFTGVAGAIDESLNIGDIVVANSLIQHDMDATPFFPRFHIPLTDTYSFPVNENYVQLSQISAQKFLKEIMEKVSLSALKEFEIHHPKCVVGTIASGDQFISDAEEARNLSQQIKNLMCVEMEGAAVAQVCHEHDIPFAVVRIISDKANHSSQMDFPKFLEKVASQYSLEIVRNFLST